MEKGKTIKGVANQPKNTSLASPTHPVFKSDSLDPAEGKGIHLLPNYSRSHWDSQDTELEG